MFWIILIIVWIIFGGIYIKCDWWFDEQSLVKNTISFISILPIAILMLFVDYISGYIIIQFGLCDKIAPHGTFMDAIEIFYPFYPFYIKKKWINHLQKDKKYLGDYILFSGKKLQEIIIDSTINNGFFLQKKDFESITDNYTKYKYVKSKKDICSYEKEWLLTFTATERDRKINEILDL